MAKMLSQLEANNVRVVGIGKFLNSITITPLITSRRNRETCSTLTSQSLHRHSLLLRAGLEKFGLEEFEENNYWKSELYIDNEKKIHKALALTKVGWVGTFMMLFANKSVKEAAQKTKDTPGNFQGDGRCVIKLALFLLNMKLCPP